MVPVRTAGRELSRRGGWLLAACINVLLVAFGTGILGIAISIAIKPADPVDRWVHVLPAPGDHVLRDGRLMTCSRREMERMLGHFAHRVTAVPAMFEHGEGARSGIAAGWVRAIEIRASGLWALVAYEHETDDEIRDLRWGYISGRFGGFVERRCTESGEEEWFHVTTLVEVTLTNMPAFGNLAPVIDGIETDENGKVTR